VQPHPPKLTNKPRTLQPLMLLPRDRLPLSYFDFATPLGEFEYARSYESNIKILDLESRMGNRPVVLIARLETNKTIYAIERQDGGLYSLCKLGHWINLEKLNDDATVANTKLLRPRDAPARTIPDAATTPQLHRENKKRRLAIEAIQSLVKRPARSQTISSITQIPETAPTSGSTENETAPPITNLSADSDFTGVANPAALAKDSAILTVPEAELPQPTAADIFDTVRNQYWEALYHSRVYSLTAKICIHY
jgi:DNA replication regulator SLD3